MQRWAIAANSGIGFMIEYYFGMFDATGTYAAILILVIMSVGLTEVLTLIEPGCRMATATEGDRA